MEIAALGSALVLLVAWNVVGVRMLLLARRTGGTPELTLGLGLFLLAAVGYPMTVLAQIPDMPAGARAAMVIVGTLFTNAGMVSLYVFTWRVFRPSAPWATTLLLGAIALATLHFCGWVDATLGAKSQSEALEAGLPWAFLQLALVSGCFGWAGLESLRQWASARRRLRLGLADPVVVNRFLLWGAMGSVAAATAVFDLAIILVAAPWSQPVVTLASSLSGMLDGLLIWLAFFPPRSYLAWVRGAASPA